MNLLDIFIAAIVVAAAVHGFMTGAIKQIASFASLLFAFVVGLTFMDSAGATVGDMLGLSPALAPLAGFIVVFLAVQLAVIVVVKVVERIIGALNLTAVNRLAGSGVGILKGTLALSVAFMVFGYIGIPAEQTRRESMLYEPVSEVLPQVWSVVGGWSAVQDLKSVFRRVQEENTATH
ncbi:MAG: CvpA family protein [Bacteroidetes bacterium]|nr:CvpA family protein [Bacteroidota bacterium]